jgi:hypothetical protein
VNLLILICYCKCVRLISGRCHTGPPAWTSVRFSNTVGTRRGFTPAAIGGSAAWSRGGPSPANLSVNPDQPQQVAEEPNPTLPPACHARRGFLAATFLSWIQQAARGWRRPAGRFWTSVPSHLMAILSWWIRFSSRSGCRLLPHMDGSCNSDSSIGICTPSSRSSHDLHEARQRLPSWTGESVNLLISIQLSSSAVLSPFHKGCLISIWTLNSRHLRQRERVCRTKYIDKRKYQSLTVTKINIKIFPTQKNGR